MGGTLERHPFSGLIHSAGELLLFDLLVLLSLEKGLVIGGYIPQSLADSDFHGHRPAVWMY
jgi:hypothetical protein